MKSFIVTIGIIGCIGMLISSAVSAADSATVAATVTVQNISVSVSPGTIAYGTLAANASAGTNPSQTQTLTNNGNVAEDFNIKGQNSLNWTLAATTGSDQYIHRFCVATCGTPPTNYTALTTSNATLATNIAGNGGTQTFDLYVTTPNPSTVFTQQSVDVVVTAVAH